VIISAPQEVWLKTILPSGSTIKQAINALNENSQKIVLVIDESKRLIGTISDGDIRRGLLRNLNLSDTVNEIISRNSIVTTLGKDLNDIIDLMTINKIQQVPIIDNNENIVGLYIWENETNSNVRKNLFVVMAGGKGTRLLPQTQNYPKPMLEVSGKPMLEHIILRAKKEGFFKFVIAVHYFGNIIEEYFGDGKRFDIQIEYLKEESPLGTAGALSLLNPQPDLPFVLTNGDVLSDIRYGELLDFHIENQAAATMAVKIHEWQNPYGVVLTNGIDVIGYQEKPISLSKINAGVYVLSPNVLSSLVHNTPIDMPNLLENIQANCERVVAYSIHEDWADIGLPSEFLRANSRNTKDAGN
jgi:dTDP-glucose pyrophosphorylase